MGMDNGPWATFPVETSVHGKVARGPIQGVLHQARYEVPPPKLFQRSSSPCDDDPLPVEDREVPFRPSDQPEREERPARRSKGVRFVPSSRRPGLGSLRALSLPHVPLLTRPSGAVLP